MSITFWAPDAPRETKRVPCCVCEGSGVDSYVQGLDCPYCAGRGWDDETCSTLPEINMANANAWAMQQALGLVPDYSGRWDVWELSTIESKLALMACGVTSVFLEKEPSREGILISGGRDHDYVVTRAKELLALVQQAKAAGYFVCWG